MSNPNQCVVTVSAPPRGTSTQEPVQFSPAEVVVTKSWGLQPGTALIDWVSAQSQPAIVSLASLTIEVGGHVFYGYVQSVVPKLGTDGISMMQEFVDNRDYLMWDLVYGVFNMPEHKIVDGQFIRRYWHILPWDFNTRTKTYTSAPYTAEAVLDMLFGAPTIESPWERWYYGNYAEYAAMGTPVYQLDFENGVYLGQAVLQVTEALGMLFTLMGGPYRLVWTIKGEQTLTLPPFPVNSDNRRTGFAVTKNPTRVRVLGDRNRYEVLNCPLEPDWLPAWQENFGLDFAQFVKDIHDHEKTAGAIGTPGSADYVAGGTPYTAIPSDVDGLRGWQLAGARARLLTVGDYADLVNGRSAGSGEFFRDTRRFQGRSRTQLPVALYLSQVVWHAFRLPANFSIRLANRQRAGLFALDLTDRAVVDVTHDPVTGEMFYLAGTPPTSEHNGYAIVRGFQTSDAFDALRPEYFKVEDFINAQQLWNYTPFEIDDSGEGDQFILFDQPALQCGTLLQQVVIDGTPQTYPDGRARVAVDASQTSALSAPAVSAALVFLGEKFSYVAGTGTRDGVDNVTGLNGEYVTFYGASHGTPPVINRETVGILTGGDPGMLPIELPFADGQLATQKAAAIAGTLLNQQFLYYYGGYRVQGSNATQLTSLIDRVTVRLNVTGLTEDVDWTNERSKNVSMGPHGQVVVNVEPEREFDRRAQLAPLFPGQEQLKVEANQLRLASSALAGSRRQAQMIADEFHRLMGVPPPARLFTDGGPAGDYYGGAPLPAGCPLFREADGNRCVLPNNAAADALENNLTKPVFVGVTVMDNQDPTGPVAVTGWGGDGVVPVRLHLQAGDQLAAGDQVGLPADNGARDYLVPSPATAVGELMDDFSDNTTERTVLCRVKLSGVGGGGGAAPGGSSVWL